NEDDSVCEKEKEYLSILINSFGLSEDMLETFINFAENPDEKMILDMMQSFATKDIKYNFMVEAMMIASIDGVFDDAENAIIEQYFEMFKITVDEAKDLRYIYEMFYKQDGNALFRYFGKKDKNTIHIIKPELFQYLLDYYKIDMAYELQEDEKKILTLEFFKPTFEKGLLGHGAAEIMTKPVSNAQFCIFLNAFFMDDKIEFDGHGKIVESESKELLMDLDHSDIEFEDGVFIISSAEDEEKKVTGVTFLVTYMFTVFVEKKTNVKYFISSYIGMPSFSLESFDILPNNELLLLGHYDSRKGQTGGYLAILKNMTTNGCTISTLGGGLNSQRVRITGNFNSDDVSFRMMKLPEESE
ncbi:MAG: hypothetical protein Q9M28_07270, partial [Mariprofundaceae bacterium]|nr:hypothetical protein [Mariprofundaceae bacterium]